MKWTLNSSKLHLLVVVPLGGSPEAPVSFTKDEGCFGFGPGLYAGYCSPNCPFHSSDVSFILQPISTSLWRWIRCWYPVPESGREGKGGGGGNHSLWHTCRLSKFLPFVPVITPRPTVSSPLKLGCLVSAHRALFCLSGRATCPWSFCLPATVPIIPLSQLYSTASLTKNRGRK